MQIVGIWELNLQPSYHEGSNSRCLSSMVQLYSSSLSSLLPPLLQGTMEEKIYDRQVTKQSLSFRVVDQQQIERHFTTTELAELYTFEPELLDETSGKKRKSATPVLPKVKNQKQKKGKTKTKSSFFDAGCKQLLSLLKDINYFSLMFLFFLNEKKKKNPQHTVLPRM